MFMGFSITSAVLGGVIIICYSMVISQVSSYDSYNNHRGKVAVVAIMLVLGIVTSGAGIWAAICTCLMKPCCCCRQPQVR